MVSRNEAKAILSREQFDVLVIGGGATGAGVAFDAATRGYSVALVEKRDYAAGTSSRSSKLIHGGLRYLQNFDLGLVREALLERQINVALAPNIVTPLPIVVPSFDGSRPDRLVGLGLNMYDVMAVDRNSPLWRKVVRAKELALTASQRARKVDTPASDQTESPELISDWSPKRHRLISGEEVLSLIPALAGRSPSGGYLFYDCQTDDVRLVLTILQAAQEYGVVSCNGLEATNLRLIDGRAKGAIVREVSTEDEGNEFEIKAKYVVNATGVWADQIRPGELHDDAEVPRIRPSRGTHILISSEKLPLVAGAIAPAEGKRTVFILPWLGSTLIGTTDNDYTGDLDNIRPSKEDIGYLLNATNAFFGSSLTSEDIDGAFAGVRPLISTADSKKSVDISRKAELFETSSAMITITGGKLTTWRKMAQLAVDTIVEREGEDLPCRTDSTPLTLPIGLEQLPMIKGIDQDSYTHLANRYGHFALDVIALVIDEPKLAKRILPSHPDLMAEVVYATRQEQAQSLGDIFLRRTRLGLLAGRALCVPNSEFRSDVAKVLGKELGWNRRERARAEQEFLDEMDAEGIIVS